MRNGNTIEVENPYNPEIIREQEDSSIVKCARCKAGVPEGVDYSLKGRTSSYSGEMVTKIELNKNKSSLETTTCTTCDGKEQINVPYTDPLPNCIRCRGRGFVAKAEEKEVRKRIQELKEANKTKRDNMDTEGIVNTLVSLVVQTEEEKEIQKLENKLDTEPYERTRLIETCSHCGGSGIDDNERTDEDGFLTECYRCNGSGQRITEVSAMYSSVSEINPSCDVCQGEGTLTVDMDPPFVTCSTCNGWGYANWREKGFTGDKRSVDTCESCNGLGFASQDSLQTTGDS